MLDPSDSDDMRIIIYLKYNIILLFSYPRLLFTIKHDIYLPVFRVQYMYVSSTVINMAVRVKKTWSSFLSIVPVITLFIHYLSLKLIICSTSITSYSSCAFSD